MNSLPYRYWWNLGDTTTTANISLWMWFLNFTVIFHRVDIPCFLVSCKTNRLIIWHVIILFCIFVFISTKFFKVTNFYIFYILPLWLGITAKSRMWAWFSFIILFLWHHLYLNLHSVFWMLLHLTGHIIILTCFYIPIQSVLIIRQLGYEVWLCYQTIM